jgi:hypothetical protein
MNRSAKVYAHTIIAAGGAVLAGTLLHWPPQQHSVFLVYLAIAVLTSLVKLRLPHIHGTYSINSLVLLYGLARLSPAETLVAGCVGVAVQSLINSQKRPRLVQVLFNMANVTLSLAVCFVLSGILSATPVAANPAARLGVVAAVYFVVNTMLVSGVLALLQGQSFSDTCAEWYLWSFPYYLTGAAFVGLTLHPRVGEAWLVLVPLVYLIHFFCGLAEWRGSHKLSAESAPSAPLPKAARIYLAIVIAAGGSLIWAALLQFQTQDWLRFASYLALAVVASTLKVRLPGLKGTLSPNFVLLLVAVSQLSLSETVLIAMVAAAVQSLWRPKHMPKLEQVLFNAAAVSLGSGLAFVFCNQAMAGWTVHSLLGRLVLATFVLYGCNTLIIAAMLCLVERRPLHHSWQLCHFWSFPYYLVGTAVAAMMTATTTPTGWFSALPIASLMILVCVSYRTHVAQLARQQL